VKQGTPCEYRPSKSKEPSTGSVAALTPSSEATALDQPTPVFPANDATSDLVTLNVSQARLIHHYTTLTAKTLAHDAASESIFTNDLVLASFSYPFLLHALLALAALHLARLEGLSSSLHAEYGLLADRHHQAALSDFRATVRDIDQTNWKAVLLFAGALFPYTYTASASASDDLELAFNNFLSHLSLTRRVRPMVTGFYQEMMQSELAQLIPDDVKDVDWESGEVSGNIEYVRSAHSGQIEACRGRSNPPSSRESAAKRFDRNQHARPTDHVEEKRLTYDRLVQLQKFSDVVHHIYPPDIVDAYSHAIRILNLMFAAAAASPKPPSDALLNIWIHFVSERYIELLSERQPGSLIVLAHYAVLLRRSREQYWYLEGVAEQIIDVANAFVPTEWKSWLEWPNMQIRGGPATPKSG
jgi:hypothetical protein